MLEAEPDRSIAGGDDLGSREHVLLPGGARVAGGALGTSGGPRHHADRLTQQSLSLDEQLVLVDRGADRRVPGPNRSARARLDDGYGASTPRATCSGRPCRRWALGFLEPSVGRPDSALLQLDGLAEHWDRMGMVDHGLTHWPRTS